MSKKREHRIRAIAKRRWEIAVEQWKRSEPARWNFFAHRRWRRREPLLETFIKEVRETSRKMYW